jgi:DNA-binding CsgD family transcriptional regulator
MPDINNCTELTDRELEILHLLAAGQTNQQIADNLCITIRTVKFHTNNIYSKLEVASRAAAIAWAWEHGAIKKSSSQE